MNFPVYLHFASLRVHPHLFFEALAYGVGFRLYVELRKTRGDFLDGPRRWWIVAAATTGALFGALALALLEQPVRLLTGWHQLQTFLAGKTIVGALIGGLFAVEWTKRILGITQHTGDLFALPLCLGIAIGRIGCFLTGLTDQTYGNATALPWGVDFGDRVPRHPTQLYEVVFLLGLALVLARLWWRPYLRGDVFKLFMVAYFALRLAIDFLKPDVRVWLGLSSIQWACLAMLIYYRADIVRWARRGGIAYERVENEDGYQVREPVRSNQ
jgi:phosphatidylglycerol---prolipoprotein diacylglyceryl transferase